VRVEIGDTDALRIISLWRGESEVWLVDALRKGGDPGQRYRLDHEEVLAVPQPHAGAHSLSLPECLRWIALASPEMAAVRYRLYGIEPETIDARSGLSSCVERAVAEAADEILADLRVADAGSGPP
jgi:hydrogenase maturation protease